MTFIFRSNVTYTLTYEEMNINKTYSSGNRDGNTFDEYVIQFHHCLQNTKGTGVKRFKAHEYFSVFYTCK